MNAYEKIRKALNTGDSCDLLTAMDALAELERAAAEPVAYCNGDNLNIGIPLRFQAFTRQQAFASTPLYATPPPAPVAEIREAAVTDDVASILGRALRCAPEFAREVVRAVQRELGPTIGLVELKEPTPEECERIYSFWIGAEGCSGRTPGERMGRIMFDACRAVMWPKEGL